jgi:CelD/BcsL family acetyltransferase involved in cellulose biosynthesis
LAAITANFSKGLRSDIRRCRRQLEQRGKLELISSREPARLAELFEQLLDVEASGWKGAAGEGTAIKLHPELVRFYGTLLQDFGSTGACEINLLQLDGQTIAGNFCLLSNDTWYQVKIAYDEQFRKQSPGYVLLETVFARLCDDPRVQTANILTGAEWAERMYPEPVGVWRMVAANHTASGILAFQMIKLRHFAATRLVPFVRRLKHRLQRRTPVSSSA